MLYEKVASAVVTMVKEFVLREVSTFNSHNFTMFLSSTENAGPVYHFPAHRMEYHSDKIVIIYMYLINTYLKFKDIMSRYFKYKIKLYFTE